MTDKTTNQSEPQYTHDEKLAIKYNLIRGKILHHYHRGIKYLGISKIVIAVAFVLFTLIAVVMSHKTGDTMQWLLLWIALIFANVTIFIIAEYTRYLIDDKVIPYLMDDDKLEFGEYSIFIDNDDEEEEEE